MCVRCGGEPQRERNGLQPALYERDLYHRQTIADSAGSPIAGRCFPTSPHGRPAASGRAPGLRKPTADDTTEICGVRIHGKFQTDIINVYRPPIRRTRDDDRTDNFDPGALPSGDNTIILGDFNGHHPSWDYECDAADEPQEGGRISLCFYSSSAGSTQSSWSLASV
ncbi:hypothetical protein FJT64_026694 [Amphibalanus amphitrite]|uniref:Endonuclease/exonuclease/phosphatase domain-containing protein n=1 Tax=Amphibalanus amphitrite TaxID=1232801 RepID=A0A6A4W122_AMPAM|nr:hypothetical protein FJT64_026694 [Amphibalanus amphitrite]